MIRTLLKLSLLAATAAMAIPAAPVLVQTATAATPLSEAAQRFGTLYVPVDLTVETAITGFDKEFEPSIRANANMVALVKANPGLIEAAGEAGRKAMADSLRRALPATQQRVAALAAARMTNAEIEDYSAYLSSSAGMKLQRAIAETADTSTLAQEMRATGEIPRFDGEKLLAMVNPAALGRLDKDELASLIKFSASPTGRKIDAVGAEFAELVATEMNAIILAMKPDVVQAVVTAMSAHLGRKESMIAAP